MDLINKIHHHLSAELLLVNQTITNSLTTDEELIKAITNHLAQAGGKRIRPILTILSAKLHGYNGTQAINLASAVELIHMATLLHDDVIDGSKTRRFLPTANLLWGSKASILVGDFLFSQAFKLIVATDSISALRLLSTAAALIAEGEVKQLAQLEQAQPISEEDYLQIIQAKTAELFSAACGTGVIIAQESKCANIDNIRIMQEFGFCLGSIFQITDDSLDYFSAKKRTGKNMGDDFLEGKITLPIILLLHQVTSKDYLIITKLFQKKTRTIKDFTLICKYLNQHNIQEAIKLYLHKLKLQAKEILTQLTIIDKKHEINYLYLSELIDFAADRTY